MARQETSRANGLVIQLKVVFVLSHAMKNFHEHILSHPISSPKIIDVYYPIGEVVGVEHGRTLQQASISFFWTLNLHGAAPSYSSARRHQAVFEGN
jgi:hypothetical protein